MRSPTNRPVAKVQAVIGAGGIATLLLWILPTFFEIEIPNDAAIAAGAIIVWIVVSIAGYITPPSADDMPKLQQAQKKKA